MISTFSNCELDDLSVSVVKNSSTAMISSRSALRPL
jgi:hypothetical protein